MEYMVDLEQPEGSWWLSFFEFWNNAGGEPNSFRVTVYLTNDNGNFYFYPQATTLERVDSTTLQWVDRNTKFPIPLGEWLNLEMYILQGDADKGRFYMAATTEDGGEKTVIYDVSGTTQHPRETCLTGFQKFQPLKLYAGGDLIRYMDGRNLQIYWDDLKFYINKQPDIY